MFLLWILGIVCSLTRAQNTPGYLIAAPSVFRSGVEEAVSVTIFNTLIETKVQVKLVVKGETVASGYGSVLDKGTVKIKVPPGLRGQAHLKVWGNRHLNDGGFIFHNSTTVTVDSKGLSLFIQTDKPVYKPKQKVLINMYMVTPDLRPAKEKVEAYVMDPRGSRIIQWMDLNSICCGIINMSFPLSDQPVFGEWLIFAETQGHVFNKSFSVQKYVLPKFELVISPPSFIQDINVCEKGKVLARYTFGKPVSGLLTINMTVTGVGYYRYEIGHQVLKSMEVRKEHAQALQGGGRGKSLITVRDHKGEGSWGVKMVTKLVKYERPGEACSVLDKHIQHVFLGGMFPHEKKSLIAPYT